MPPAAAPQPCADAADSQGVTRWYLIAAAVLAAGCEQLKSPQRLKELEGKVEQLTAQVAELKGGSGAAKAKTKAKAKAKADPDDHEGSGSASEPAEPGVAGKPVAEGHEPHEGSDHAAAAEPAADPAAPEGDEALARLKALAAKKPERKAEPAHWGYDGKVGPPMWGTLDPAWQTCQTGTAQSPIDIEPKAGTASPITFRYKPTAGTIIDNGHTLQVNLAAGNSIEIDGQPYALKQLHFHSPSEHTIAGEHYPLEIHLVHQDAAGKIAVIGVLYDAGADSKPLDAVWSKWPHKVGVEDKLRKPFDPAQLLPATRTVFRYTGSLTTPPCTEGVVWNVMRRTLSDGKLFLDAFGRHYPHNARDVQAQNERKIE